MMHIYTIRVRTLAHKYIESSLYTLWILHIFANLMDIFRDMFELWLPMIAILHLLIGPVTCTV